MEPWLSWSSPCRSGWPQTHRVPPAFASCELGLNSRATSHYGMYVCECMCVEVRRQLESIFPSALRVLRIELRSSDLVASTFIY